MSGVAGLRGTGDWGTDERPKSFRERILFMDPNGDSPIFALSGKAGKYPAVTDPEFSWWCETNTIVRLTINGALGSGDTTITVDSADPTSTTLDSVYGTATHLKPGDVLIVDPAASALGDSYAPEYLEVTAVLSDTQFTARRGVGGTTAASIADNKTLTLVNSVYSEGSSAPAAVARNPVKFSNYTQIFKDTYELSGTADQTEARTGDAWSNDKKRKMFDHSRSIEHTALYAYKATESSDPTTGKPKRFTKGLRGFIPATNTHAFTAAVSTSDILDKVQPAYDSFSLPGSGDTRIGFTGYEGLKQLNLIVKADADIQMQFGDVIRMWGMDFRELIMPWGRMLLKAHPLLSRHSLFRTSLYVMDFAAFKWAPLRGRDTKPKDDVQADDEDVRRGYVMTEGGWHCDGGGLTMAIVDGLSAT